MSFSRLSVECVWINHHLIMIWWVETVTVDFHLVTLWLRGNEHYSLVQLHCLRKHKKQNKYMRVKSECEALPCVLSSHTHTDLGRFTDPLGPTHTARFAIVHYVPSGSHHLKYTHIHRVTYPSLQRTLHSFTFTSWTLTITWSLLF